MAAATKTKGKTTLVPLADRIVITPLKQEEVTASGLVIPDTAKEKPQQGEVVAVGPGRLDDNGKWWIDHIVEGDSVREVLSYVQYDAERLRQEIRRECEKAVRDNRLTVADSQSLSKAYEGGLQGYTYLEEE